MGLVEWAVVVSSVALVFSAGAALMAWRRSRRAEVVLSYEDYARLEEERARLGREVAELRAELDKRCDCRGDCGCPVCARPRWLGVASGGPA